MRAVEMKVAQPPDNSRAPQLEPSDTEILALFHRQPDRAWGLFLERYADAILSHLRDLGFDYDQAMDRFVYVCTKLSDDDYRRLKTVRYAGRDGELIPWLRQVVKNLCINWAWSTEGRRRLLKPITRLPAREQRIFELYFWSGLSPSAIYEQLRLEHHRNLSLVDVLAALERILSLLSRKKLERLMSNLVRARGPVSLDELDGESRPALQLPDTGADPESLLIQKETAEQLERALAELLPKERLVVQFRYEEGMAVRETAEMLRMSEAEVTRSLRTAVTRMKRSLKKR